MFRAIGDILLRKLVVLLRVIAGTAKGRKFDTLSGLDTRPTLDRVRESVFGMLQFEIVGRAVLDLFAGSGGMGIEALSRGASSAVFCDQSPECAAIIKSNLKHLNLNGEVLCNDFEKCLSMLEASGKRFDFVFIDPPYASDFVDRATSFLEKSELLNNGACIVIEHPKDRIPAIPDGLVLRADRKYGKAHILSLIHI